MSEGVNVEHMESRKYKKRELPPGQLSQKLSILKQTAGPTDFDESIVTSESYFKDEEDEEDDDVDKSKLFAGDSFFDENDIPDARDLALKKLNLRSVQSPSNSLYMPGKSYVRVNSKISGPIDLNKATIRHKTSLEDKFEPKNATINADIPDYYKNVDWKRFCQSYLDFGVQGDAFTPFREAPPSHHSPNLSKTAPKQPRKTSSEDCDLDFYFQQFQKCFLSQRKRAQAAECSSSRNGTPPRQMEECNNDNFDGGVATNFGLVGDVGDDSFREQVKKWCYEDMAQRKELKQHLKRQQVFKQQTFADDCQENGTPKTENNYFGQKNSDMFQLQMQQSQLKALLLEHQRCQQQQQEFKKQHLSNGHECSHQNQRSQCLQQQNYQMPGQPNRVLYDKRQNLCQQPPAHIKQRRNIPSPLRRQSPQEPCNYPRSFRMSKQRREYCATHDRGTPNDQSCPDGAMTVNPPKLINKFTEECSISSEASDVEGVGRQRTSQLQYRQQHLSYMPQQPKQQHSQKFQRQPQAKPQNRFQQQKSTDCKGQFIDLCNEYLACSYDQVDKKIRSNLKRERETCKVPDQAPKHGANSNIRNKNLKFDQTENCSNWSSDTDNVKVFYCKCKAVKSPKHGQECNLDDNLDAVKTKSNKINPNSAKQSQKSCVSTSESSSSTTCNKPKSPINRCDGKPEDRFSSPTLSNKKAKTAQVKSSGHDKKCYIIMSDCSDPCLKCKCKCCGTTSQDKRTSKLKKATDAAPNTSHQKNEQPSCSDDDDHSDECSESAAYEAQSQDELSEKNPLDKINDLTARCYKSNGSNSDNSEESPKPTGKSNKTSQKSKIRSCEPVQKHSDHSGIAKKPNCSHVQSSPEAIIKSTSNKAKDCTDNNETECEDSNSSETLANADFIARCSDQMCDAVTDEVFGKLLYLCKKNKLCDANKSFLDDDDVMMNSMIKCLYFLNCIMKFDNLKKKYCRSVDSSKSKNRKIR